MTSQPSARRKRCTRTRVMIRRDFVRASNGRDTRDESRCESTKVVKSSDVGPRTSDVGPLQRVRAAGTAAARDRALANRAVVVAQFLAAADDAGGADPDRLVDDLEPAVRCAGVVDEPRDVPAHVRVAAPHAVDAEDPDAALLQVLIFARVELFAVADELAGVVDDARALR